jgi:hypothetical protein
MHGEKDPVIEEEEEEEEEERSQNSQGTKARNKQVGDEALIIKVKYQGQYGNER